MEIKHQASPNSISTATVESSIDKLVANWKRRQRWQLFFHCNKQQALENGVEQASWRTHLANFLDSTPLHLLSLSLLLLDLILTVLDLSSSLLSCSSSSKKNSNADMLYHWGGTVILVMLSTKSVVLAVALGRYFFRQPGLVVDGVVVIGALVLETLVVEKGGGLLVVVSLWRVVRVVESAFELSDEAIEALKDENQSLHEAILDKENRIAELEESLAQCGSDCLKEKT